jgi:hypothetical protein
VSEPTIASLLRHQCRLYVTCAACGHERVADLEQLAARGWADRTLSSLPWRCECGSRRVTFTVMPISTLTMRPK